MSNRVVYRSGSGSGSYPANTDTPDYLYYPVISVGKRLLSRI